MSALIAAGHRWWTTEQACAQLRVHRKRLSDWVRRSRSAGHVGDAEVCPRCETAGDDGFPHVDAPVRVGRLAAYVADQLLDAELYTATSTRGGRLRA